MSRPLDTKTVLFFPGFPENIKSRDYQKVLDAIQSEGYRTEFIPVNWSRTTPDDWLEATKTEYLEHNNSDTVLAGFSFGAVLAFSLAAELNPNQLWLFSLSPYFHEDIHSKHMKASWLKNLGKRRVVSFDKLNFKNMSGQIKCPTKLFAGSKELDKWPGFRHRFQEAGKIISHSESFVIDGVSHDIADDRYVEAIITYI